MIYFLVSTVISNKLLLFYCTSQQIMITLQSSPSNNLKQSLLRNLIQQLETKTNHQRQQQKSITLAKYTNPQNLRDSIKLSKVWKGTGKLNKQFGDIKPLNNKGLSQWQIQRMPLAKRSYSSPKEFKGIKYDAHSRQLTLKNSKQLYSQEFNRYLQTMKQKYQENLFRQNVTELKKMANKKKQFSVPKLIFTTSANFFGIPMQSKKLGTLKSFNSEILKRGEKFE